MTAVSLTRQHIFLSEFYICFSTSFSSFIFSTGGRKETAWSRPASGLWDLHRQQDVRAESSGWETYRGVAAVHQRGRGSGQREGEQRGYHLPVRLTHATNEDTSRIKWCFHCRNFPQELGTFAGISVFPPQGPASKLGSVYIILLPKKSLLVGSYFPKVQECWEWDLQCWTILIGWILTAAIFKHLQPWTSLFFIHQASTHRQEATDESLWHIVIIIVEKSHIKMLSNNNIVLITLSYISGEISLIFACLQTSMKRQTTTG